MPNKAPAPRRGTSRRERAAPSSPPRAAPKPAPAAQPLTLSLMAAQSLLIVLAIGCFLGALFKHEWDPPAWSLFQENELILAGSGIGLVFAAIAARRFPILATLAVVLAALAACGLHYRTDRVVDASRVVALSLSMVALWLAMEHRGVT